MTAAKGVRSPVEVWRVGFDCHKQCTKRVEVLRVGFLTATTNVGGV